MGHGKSSTRLSYKELPRLDASRSPLVPSFCRIRQHFNRTCICKLLVQYSRAPHTLDVCDSTHDGYELFTQGQKGLANLRGVFVPELIIIVSGGPTFFTQQTHSETAACLHA